MTLIREIEHDVFFPCDKIFWRLLTVEIKPLVNYFPFGIIHRKFEYSRGTRS